MLSTARQLLTSPLQRTVMVRSGAGGCLFFSCGILNIARLFFVLSYFVFLFVNFEFDSFDFSSFLDF
jgi:hypothetical protein